MNSSFIIKNAFPKLVFCFVLFGSTSVFAEYRQYGEVILDGLTVDGANRNSTTHYAMVCNVNGPDGFLSIRSGPGAKYKARRKLNRLARLTVNPRYQKNGWVPVETADRFYSKNGYRLGRSKSLHVQGWAYGNYICDYLIAGQQPKSVQTPAIIVEAPESAPVKVVVKVEDNSNKKQELNSILSELKSLNSLLWHINNLNKSNSVADAKKKAISDKIEQLKSKNSILLKNNKSIDLSVVKSMPNLDMITASEYFPKIAYNRPGTNDKGVMWLKPRITDVGGLEYDLSFVAPNSKFDDIRESLTLKGKDLEIVSKGLVKAYDWAVVAKKKNIRKIYEKVSGCVSDSSCEEKKKGNSSVEILFKIYEDGATGAGLRINKGTYSKGYNYSMDNALLLSAYIEFMQDIANKELEAGSMTNNDLDNLFE